MPAPHRHEQQRPRKRAGCEGVGVAYAKGRLPSLFVRRFSRGRGRGAHPTSVYRKEHCAAARESGRSWLQGRADASVNGLSEEGGGGGADEDS